MSFVFYVCLNLIIKETEMHAGKKSILVTFNNWTDKNWVCQASS